MFVPQSFSLRRLVGHSWVVMGLHQRGMCAVGYCVNIRLIKASFLISTVRTGFFLLSGNYLLSFYKLFGVVDGAHDILVSWLLHHVSGDSLWPWEDLTVLSWGWIELVLGSRSHLISLITHKTTLIYLPPGTIKRIFTLNIPWGAHRVWELRSLFFERKFEGPKLRLCKLIFYFLFKVYKFCLNLRIYVSGSL